MIEEIKTSTTEEWEKYRRPELLTLYRENVYGYCPFPVPETVTGVIQDTERTEDGYIREEDLLYIEHYAMPITLFYPVIGSNNKIVIYLRLSDQKETDIPIKMITDRGYTLIQVWVESIASDAENCLQTGLFRYFNSAKHRTAAEPSAPGVMVCRESWISFCPSRRDSRTRRSLWQDSPGEENAVCGRQLRMSGLRW